MVKVVPVGAVSSSAALLKTCKGWVSQLRSRGQRNVSLLRLSKAIDGLTHLVTVEQAARERGLEVSQIGYKSRAKSKTESHDHRKAAVVGASPNAAEVA